MKDKIRKEAIKAAWLVKVVEYSAQELGKDISETLDLMEEKDLVYKLLSGYDVLHTQGYEYMAETVVRALTDLEVDVALC